MILDNYSNKNSTLSAYTNFEIQKLSSQSLKIEKPTDQNRGYKNFSLKKKSNLSEV